MGQVCAKCGARRIDAQLGLERTPEEYVARMVEVFRDVKRVLADDGTLWLNLGDSYVGTSGAGTRVDHTNTGGAGTRSTSARPAGMRPGADNPLKAKDLVGIPWRVAFALQADGWYLRSDIIWAKPNPMPESVTDRPTKAHEYVFLLAKSQRYYYDAAAIAEEALNTPGGRLNGNTKHAADWPAGSAAEGRGLDRGGLRETRNRRTVWTVATQPFSGAHFAVMPEALVEPCVLAGSAPGDIVLDPFAGSGTVGVVALRHGRRFIGCELNAEYAQMARRRVAGPLFAEEVAR
jgi:DNA modification methylase